jgi:hypothetical protein
MTPDQYRAHFMKKIRAAVPAETFATEGEDVKRCLDMIDTMLCLILHIDTSDEDITALLVRSVRDKS